MDNDPGEPRRVKVDEELAERLNACRELGEAYGRAHRDGSLPASIDTNDKLMWLLQVESLQRAEELDEIRTLVQATCIGFAMGATGASRWPEDSEATSFWDANSIREFSRAVQEDATALARTGKTETGVRWTDDVHARVREIARRGARRRKEKIPRSGREEGRSLRGLLARAWRRWRRMASAENLDLPQLVYGVTERSGMGLANSFVILPRHVLDHLADQVSACGRRTWGELRKSCPPEIYDELLGLAGYKSYEEFSRYLQIGRPMPGAETEMRRLYGRGRSRRPSRWKRFDPERQIPSYADGDWPPSRFLLMNEWLPPEVIEGFGNQYSTSFNGDFVEFDPAREPEILACLTALGFDCVEDGDLIGRTDPV